MKMLFKIKMKFDSPVCPQQMNAKLISVKNPTMTAFRTCTEDFENPIGKIWVLLGHAPRILKISIGKIWALLGHALRNFLEKKTHVLGGTL